jgi:small subunit ribosomal protein S2
MHNNIEFYTTRQLIKKKIHLGHLAKDWNPKINIFLFGSRTNIHFIDLQQTIFLFRRALNFLQNLKKNNYKILFCEKNPENYLLKLNINNKLKLKYDNILRYYAKHYDQFYLNKSVRGGLFRAILQHKNNPKLDKNFIVSQKSNIFPNVIYVTDLNYYNSILRESYKLNLVSIGLVDTNTSFINLSYPIPSNDDNYLSILFFNNLIIKTLDTSSLIFNNEHLSQVRNKLYKKYYNIF